MPAGGGHTAAIVRALLVAIAVAAVLAVVPAVAGAGARPHVSASPNPIGVNQVQTLKAGAGR